MRIPMIDLSRQHAPLLDQMRATFDRVLASGQYVLGPYVEQFETQLATLCGVGHAVGCSSESDALILTLMALGIGPGDEVITSPLAVFSSAGAIARTGATPVFVDIDPRTYCLDPRGLAAAITPQTRAILPTHLYGQPADMDPMLAVAREHGLKVIEGAAMALGAHYEGRPVGSLGDVAILSFYPSKNLAAVGDAGAVVTNDPDLAERLRRLRQHGQSSRGYVFEEIGGNFRIQPLQAALLSVKLPHLEEWNRQRRDLADRYHRLLDPLPVTTPFAARGRHHVYNLFTVRVRGGVRDELAAHLQAEGIGSRVYYPIALHQQPCFESLGYGAGTLPEAELAVREVLSLPIFPGLTYEEQDEVVRAIREFFQGD